jgi:hypothetical protein
MYSNVSEVRAVSTMMEIMEVLVALMMEAVCTSETSVCFYEIRRRRIPEGCHLQTHCRENLIDHKLISLFDCKEARQNDCCNCLSSKRDLPDNSSFIKYSYNELRLFVAADKYGHGSINFLVSVRSPWNGYKDCMLRILSFTALSYQLLLYLKPDKVITEISVCLFHPDNEYCLKKGSHERQVYHIGAYFPSAFFSNFHSFTALMFIYF